MSSKRLCVCSAIAFLGCGSAPARQPPGQPPTPASISRDEPGGDAHDPHRAALERQLELPWGRRNDKDDQVHAPTPDWRNWKRVRYWGFQHFAGFRYGDDHHVIAVLFVHDLTPDVLAGREPDGETCLREFEKWGWPQVKSYELRLGTIGLRQSEWRGHPITVKFVDGHVDLGFERREFSAAWTAYPAYPDACLVYAMAVPWDDQAELARRVRDRWVDEAFQQMEPLTKTKPVRK